MRTHSNKMMLFVLSFFLIGGSGASFVATKPTESRYRPREGNKLYETTKGINSKECFDANVQDALVNLNTPKTWADMRENHSGEYVLQKTKDSIWHNFSFWVDVVNSMPNVPESLKRDFRKVVSVYAVFEFYFLDRDKWVCLDSKFPNIKYVSKDGHREVVYNMYTGRKVDHGINQGTANASETKFSFAHVRDVFRFFKCSTPNEVQKEFARWLMEKEYVPDSVKLKTKRLFDRGAERLECTEKEDGTGADLAGALLGDDEAKVKVEQRKFDESPNRHQVGGSTEGKSSNDSSQSHAQAGSVKRNNGNDKGFVSANPDAQVGVRGWCTCPSRSAHVTLGNLFRMGTDFSVADYSYLICSECYKCRKDLDDVARLVKGPLRIWDVKVARENGVDGKTTPQGEALKRLLEAQERILKIPDGEIVVPGLCQCYRPEIWKLGESPHEIEMCRKCGRPRSAIPVSAKNPRQPRKLRRCVKTPQAVFVCVCTGETGVRPTLHASPYDDGEIQLDLMCTQCNMVKYHAFAPMREFKSRFANAKPDANALVEFLIGTTDVKAALAEADAEAASLNATKQK